MKKVIIIGAGIAGLTAGIYARRSGFDVTILEQHSIPGGMCTSWRRKGYLFEGAVHWMTGSSPRTALNQLWREAGALDDSVEVLYNEVFHSIDWNGQIICLYRDPQKLKRHFDEISPADAEATNRLIADIKTLTKMEMPITDLKGVKTTRSHKMSLGMLFKMLPALPKMGRLSKLPIDEYLTMFRHPGLRQLLGGVTPGGFSASSMLFTLATLAAGDGGYPVGGSLAMTKRMADLFTALGGKILYQAKADKVKTENGAVGGVTVSGKAHPAETIVSDTPHTDGGAVSNRLLPADAVIITQETLAAAAQLFDRPPTDEWLTRLKQETKPMACCFISIGVKALVKELPSFAPAEPIRCGGFTYDYLGMHCYADYPGYAPAGSTALTTALIGDSYDYWQKARAEGRYEAEKEAVMAQVVRALCQKYPFLEGKIEVTDLATPYTYERYTGASHGSWMSVMEPGKGNPTACPGTLEQISGVYFAGHRIMSPGGLPVALMTGRTAAQQVCRQFDTVFTAQ